MLNTDNRLFVFHDNNSVFNDISNSMLDFARDAEIVDLVAADDRLLVGFEKPINAFYVEMDVVNTTAATFTGDYFNGTIFTAIPDFLDDSRGLTRSGFFTWSRPEASQAITDEEETTIDGQSAFWYSFIPSVDIDGTTSIMGLNLVFSDDNDLKDEFFEVSDTRRLPTGQNSHILSHVAARDYIMKKLERMQFLKKKGTDTRAFNLTPWDLLTFNQLRQASKFKALEKIFNNLSDAPDDIDSIRANRYREEFIEAFDIFLMDIDLDNDGIVDTQDQTGSFKTVPMTR